MASNDGDSLTRARALERAVLCHNDVHSMVKLGCLLIDDEKFISQRARGVQMLERAIKQAQHPVAMFALADYLLNSDNKKDHFRAFSLLQRSLRLKEDTATLNLLGLCYHQGQGVAKDAKLAMQMCERALRLDQDPRIMANLATVMLHTPEMKAETKRAVDFYKKAISLSAEAELMHDLAVVYHSGKGNLSRCLKSASKWYMRAIRTSKNPHSMHNQAVILLENDPTAQGVQDAIRLLEDSLERLPRERAMITLAHAYLEHEIDMERAVLLFETAAIQFKSKRAISFLFRSSVEGMSAVHLGHARMFNFFAQEFNANRSHFSLLCAGEMTWSGTKHVKMNRKKGVEFLDMSHWNRHDCFSLMLRHDLSDHPDGRRSAQRIMKKFDEKIDRDNLKDAEAVILSEGDCEEDKLLALESFRAQIAREGLLNEVEVAWLCPHLRVSCHNLPVDGHPHCITDAMRRFTLWTNIAALNLASLLLEIEGKQQEAVKVLEGLLDSDLRLLGMLNLAHILMGKVPGAPQNRARGRQLLEDAVEETNDACARAMLANALSERADLLDGDVERGWKLWCSVMDGREEEELTSVRRLISRSSEEKWKELEAQAAEGGVDEAREEVSKGTTLEGEELSYN